MRLNKFHILFVLLYLFEIILYRKIISSKNISEYLSILFSTNCMYPTVFDVMDEILPGYRIKAKKLHVAHKNWKSL